MALVGTIKDFGLADILQLIGLQRKTGVLTLDSDTDCVTVKFLDGSVVGADTSLRNLEDLLGTVLVRTGRISAAQLQETLQIQRRTLQRLGYVLVKQGYLSDEDLEEALRIQVSQIVYRLFRWRDGKYQFTPMDQVEYDNEHFRPISAESILMEGARMIDEWPMLERKIKSPSMVFRQTEAGAVLDVPVSPVPDVDIDLGFLDEAEKATRKAAPELSSEERDVLHAVDGVATVQEIVDTSALAEFDVYRILCDLSNRKLTEVVERVAPVVDAEGVRRRALLTSLALQVVVITAAALGFATLGSNPYTPWRIAAASQESDLLKTYASRNRLERVEQALQAYYLDHGSMPGSLQTLVVESYLRPADIRNPWGHPYSYSVGATAYEIGHRPPEGRIEETIVIRHPFSASQRMILEGGAPSQGGGTVLDRRKPGS